MIKEKMANAKSYFKTNQRKMILLMCIIVVVGGLVTATLAWLTSRTDPVINNFIGSNLEISLAEEAKNFQMIPHLEITKDPKVTVKANSEACWLFLQVKESEAQANGSGIEVTQEGDSVTRSGTDYKYLSYDIDSAWTKIEKEAAIAMGLPVEENGVVVNTYYWRKVGTEGTALTQDTDPMEILAGNKVIVNDWIINEELAESQLTTNPVKITFTPVAIQQLGFPSIESAIAQIAGEFE